MIVNAWGAEWGKQSTRDGEIVGSKPSLDSQQPSIGYFSPRFFLV